MILERVLKTAAAAAAVSAAAVAAVFAAAFALYALLEPYVGRPGSAALVALVFALIAALGGLIFARGAKPKRPKPGAEEPGLAEKVIEIARTKPLLSAGAAIAAGVIALRNPALVGVIMTALLKKPDPNRR